MSDYTTISFQPTTQQENQLLDAIFMYHRYFALRTFIHNFYAAMLLLNPFDR